MKIFIKNKNKFNNIKNDFFQKVIIISMILSTLIWYVPIKSFAANEDDEEEMMQAIVPYAANGIISQFVSTSMSMRKR